MTEQPLSTAHKGGRDTGELSTAPVVLTGTQLGQGGLSSSLKNQSKENNDNIGLCSHVLPTFVQTVQNLQDPL